MSAAPLKVLAVKQFGDGHSLTEATALGQLHDSGKFIKNCRRSLPRPSSAVLLGLPPSPRRSPFRLQPPPPKEAGHIPPPYMNTFLDRFVCSWCQGAHYLDTYEVFVKRLHFINLDIGDMPPFSCLIKTDFLDRLVWKTVDPLAVLGALRATYDLARLRHRGAPSGVNLTFRRKHLSLAVVVLFFV